MTISRPPLSRKPDLAVTMPSTLTLPPDRIAAAINRTGGPVGDGRGVADGRGVVEGWSVSDGRAEAEEDARGDGDAEPDAEGDGDGVAMATTSAPSRSQIR